MAPSLTFPRAQALILAAAKVSEAIACCFVMPFVNQMVVGFGETPESAPKYAGLIDSALIVTEFIFAPFWGAASDRLGRKPLLILGLFGFALAAIGMGLAQNLWQAITARCISGVLGAVGVLVRTVQFEITTSEHVGQVLATLTPCWPLGAALGPMIGGGLAEPAKTFPWLFANTIFDRFPYLLPALVVAVVPAGSAVGYWLLVPETLGNPSAEPSEPVPEFSAQVDETTSLLSRRETKDDDDSQLLEGFVCGEPKPIEKVSSWRMIMDPKLAYPLLCSALLSFVSMAYNAAFMMMASTSLEEGGLGLASWQLGAMLGMSSGLGVLVATYLLPALDSRYGWYRTLRLTSFAHVLLFPLVIVAGIITRAEGGVGWWSAPVLVMLMVSYEIGETSFTPIDVAVSERAPRGRLGEVNGIAMSCQSIGRMAAPALSGQLWSWSIASRSTLGYQFIWIIFTIIAVIWHLTTHRLFSPAEIEARNALRINTSLESGPSPRSTLLLTPTQSYGTFSSIINSVKSLKSKIRQSPTSPDFPSLHLPSPALERSSSPESLDSGSLQPVACNVNPVRNVPKGSGCVRPLFFRRVSEMERYEDNARYNWTEYHSYSSNVPLPVTDNTLPDAMAPAQTAVPVSEPTRLAWLRQLSPMEQCDRAVEQAMATYARQEAFMASAPQTYTRVQGNQHVPRTIWDTVHYWASTGTGE